jgi:putative transcriptional regulator
MKKLKELRKAKKLTHQMMANSLNISKPFYWQIENNKRRLSYDMAVKIADILNTKPDEIFYQEFKNKSDIN